MIVDESVPFARKEYPMTDDELNKLVSWVAKTLPSLGGEEASVVADAIGGQVLSLDQRLGVEVSDHGVTQPREIIFTSYSDSSLFQDVRRIVAALPPVPGWKFIALKPARGFDFTINFGGFKVKANQLDFTPIEEMDCGIQLLIYHEMYSRIANADAAEELAWLIIETGIGEELSSKINHAQFADASKHKHNKNITDIGNFVTRFC